MWNYGIGETKYVQIPPTSLRPRIRATLTEHHACAKHERQVLVLHVIPIRAARKGIQGAAPPGR